MSSFVFNNGYKIVDPTPSGDAGEVLNENFIRSSRNPFRLPVLDYITTPPGSPSEGNRYLVASGATGAWSGQDNDIAEYTDGVWRFNTPKEGWIVRDDDEDVHYQWDGSSWDIVKIRRTIRATATNTTLLLSDSILNVDASGGDRTITLPPASTSVGIVFRVYKIDTSGNLVIIDGDGSETINGNTTVSIAKQYGNIAITSDGSDYIIVGQIPLLPIVVDPAGNGDATTIAGALAVANSFSPSTSNPILIELTAGVYLNEPNPLTVPTGVSIVAPSGFGTTFVEPATTTAAIFEIESSALVSGITARGASGAGGVGFRASGGNQNGSVNSCLVRNCETGILATGSGTILAVNGCVIFRAPGETLSVGLEATSSASLNCVSPIVGGTAISQLTTSLFANGGTISATSIVTQEATNGLYANNSGTINSQGLRVVNTVNSIRSGSSGANSIFSSSTSIENSTTFDVLIEASSGLVNIIGISNLEKRSIASGATLNFTGIDKTTNRALLGGGAKVEGGLSVGVPGVQDIFTYIGEGGPYINNEFGQEIVEYWSYDDSASSGSKFSRFASNGGSQLTADNDAIIIGSLCPFQAIKLDIDTAAVLGSGSIVAEYWNGSSWVSTDYNAYGDEEELNFRGITPFTMVETQLLEVSKAVSQAAANDVADEVPEWDDSQDHYAIRFRNSGAITSGATFSGGSVIGNDVSVHTDGDIVLWGGSRGSDNITILPSIALEPTTNAAADENINFSTNISTIGIRNSLSGSQLTQIHYRLKVPEWVDTSSPAIVKISGFQLGTGSGNIELQLLVASYFEGQNINAGTLTEFGPFSDIQAATAISGQLVEHEIEVSLPGLPPGGRVVVALERDGSVGNGDDTLVDDWVIVDIDVEFSRKRLD